MPKRLPPSRPTRSTAAIKRYQCQYKDQCHCKYQCQSNISADNQRQKVTLLRCIRLFQIADDGLPTIVDMDMFDADKLMTAMTQPSKNLNLRGIRSEQTSRSRPKRRNPPLCSKSAIQLGENCHGGCVRAGHLNGKRSFNFVLWRCGLDHSEGGVNVNF